MTNLPDFLIASAGLVLYLGFGHYFRWGGALLNEPKRSIFNYTYGTTGLIVALLMVAGPPAALTLLVLAVIGGGAVVGFYAIDHYAGQVQRWQRENKGRDYDR